MNVLKPLNFVRTRIMERLTKNVGKSYSNTKIDLKHKVDIKKILISRPNHKLGNQLLLTPLIQELIITFPDCKIDLFVKGGVAYPVFENYEQIDKIIQLPRKPFNHLINYGMCWFSIRSKRYDLVINGDKNSSSGRLSTKFAKAPFKIFGEVDEEIQQIHTDYEHISKYPIYNLRHYLTKLSFKENNKKIPTLNIKLSDSEIEKGREILNDLVKNNNKTICIYTNATNDKCYSEDWWETLYSRLLKEYSNYNIIEMLPVENISKISFKSPNFYSKDIRKMGAIINNTSVFIAADNGIMHLASASLTPTVGFFKVTNQNIYEPYGNGSLALNTNDSLIDDWIRAINTILK
jgi:ADP-heptose:LPS heptosyltransferase